MNIASITLDMESRNSVSLVQHLAADMGISVSKMWESIEVFIQASLKTAKVPDGGPYPVYSSGKSWYEASGKTSSRRSSTTMPYREPIPQHRLHCRSGIHYCMGGLEIDENSAVLGSDSEAIGGLNVAGEIAEASTAITDRVETLFWIARVFGRVARGACTRYMFGDNTKAISLAAFTSGANVEGSKSDQGQRCWR